MRRRRRRRRAVASSVVAVAVAGAVRLRWRRRGWRRWRIEFVEPFATGESVTNGVQTATERWRSPMACPHARAVGVNLPGVQLQDTISAAQTIEVTNDGAAPLDVSGMTFSGTNPQDFVIVFNGCLGPVAPRPDLCTIGVSFTPQAQGARTADLNIASNDPSSPLTVALSGTGGAAVQNATGATDRNAEGMC